MCEAGSGALSFDRVEVPLGEDYDCSGKTLSNFVHSFRKRDIYRTQSRFFQSEVTDDEWLEQASQ